MITEKHTISKYMLDDTLDIVDGDIPTQKDIMNDFFQQRVNQHLQQQSSNFIDNYNENENENENNNETEDDIDDQSDIDETPTYR